MSDESIQLLKSNLKYQRGERDRLREVEERLDEQLTRARLERQHCEAMISDLVSTLEDEAGLTTSGQGDRKR